MKNNMIWKKIAFLTILIGILSLSACGREENIIMETGAAQADEEHSETTWEAAEESTERNALPEETQAPLEVPVNTDKKEVMYDNRDGMNPTRAIHRCQSDAENVYLAYGEPDLYVMPLGADAHYPANIDNPEGLDVCSVALDAYGNVHLLMGSNDDEEWYIWQLDKDYQVVKALDISGYFEKKQMPYWFLVDKDGTYYLQWLFDRNGILIDTEGELKNSFSLEDLGANWTYEAAVGRDGEIYLVYTVEEKNFEIGRLDVESCSIQNGVFLPELLGSDTFSGMSAGTDTNLLLYSPTTGAWAYDTESGVIENRVPIADIDFENNADFWPLTFLADGRLLLAGASSQDGETEGGDSETCISKYIPVGK